MWSHSALSWHKGHRVWIVFILFDRQSCVTIVIQFPLRWRNNKKTWKLSQKLLYNFAFAERKKLWKRKTRSLASLGFNSLNCCVLKTLEIWDLLINNTCIHLMFSQRLVGTRPTNCSSCWICLCHLSCLLPSCQLPRTSCQ